MIWIMVVLTVVLHLGVPAMLLAWLWGSRYRSRTAWGTSCFVVGAYILCICIGGAGWNWLSHYPRPLLLGVFAVVATASFGRTRHLPAWSLEGSREVLALVGKLALGVLLAANLSTIVLGRFHDGGHVALEFPLRAGTYAVQNGGSNAAINIHQVVSAQRYALDIVRLEWWGGRARGIYPQELSRYAIFGEVVHAPCRGEVLQVVDGLPDLVPPEMDPGNVAGNCVVLSCEGVSVLLAHLMQGSIRVEKGEQLYVGQAVGQVGNSGNTTEPHLHIHAVRQGTSDLKVITESGDPVPMLFHDRFLVRNSIVFR